MTSLRAGANVRPRSLLAGLIGLAAVIGTDPAGAADPVPLAPSHGSHRSGPYHVSVERNGAALNDTRLGAAAVQSDAGEVWASTLVTDGPESPYLRVTTSYLVPLLARDGWHFWMRAQDGTGRYLKTEPMRRTVECNAVACTLTEVLHVRLDATAMQSLRPPYGRLLLVSRDGETRSFTLDAYQIRPEPIAFAEVERPVVVTPPAPPPVAYAPPPEPSYVPPPAPVYSQPAPAPVYAPRPAYAPAPVAPPMAPPSPAYRPVMSADDDPADMVVCEVGGVVLPRSADRCASEGGRVVPAAADSAGATMPVAAATTVPDGGDPARMIVCRQGWLVLPRSAGECLATGGRIE